MRTRDSGRPMISPAIMAMVVRSPGPTSAAPEMTVIVPSELRTTMPVDGEPPPPCKHEWAAMPMPWKTPGRTSLAFGGCHFSFHPARSVAC